MNNELIPDFDNDADESISIQLDLHDDAGGIMVLHLAGYIDTYNSNSFLSRIEKVIEAGYTRLVFHCGSLNYVSSTGIDSFTIFLKTVKSRGGNVVLLNVQPKVMEVFQLLGLSQFFAIRKNFEDALAFFISKPGSPTNLRPGGPAQVNAAMATETHKETEVSMENATGFPRIVSCPVCAAKLKAARPGRFRCAGCKSVISIA
jgi:anti-sigma B factor antagonist